MKKYHAKWIFTFKEGIRRSLQDDDYVFPNIDENGNINPKVSMPKEKFKKWLNK